VEITDCGSWGSLWYSSCNRMAEEEKIHKICENYNMVKFESGLNYLKNFNKKYPGST
jgi:hypothetical protein